MILSLIFVSCYLSVVPVFCAFVEERVGVGGLFVLILFFCVIR